jgi:FAD/FMN-containing dehydrogenase
VSQVESWLPDVERLASQSRGPVLLRGDEGYDDSRRIFNAMIDRYPVMIIRCREVADVVSGVGFARTHDLPLSVKGGGHSVAGSAICDGGVTLDLSAMTSIHIDAHQRTAVAEPGLTLADFDAATAEYGLATPLGVVSMTGIAGLTLGGGLGWLNGKYGLACDNVLAVDILTADGTVRTASAEQNEDLFWAIRGGGGNFGVVVSFTYRLHPVATVLAGGITYPPALAGAALSHYHALASTFPDELSTAASVWRNSAGEPVVSVGVCWSGTPEAGEAVLRPLRDFGPPDVDEVRLMPYASLQQASDNGFPRGRLHYWKAGFCRHLPPEAIDIVLRAVSEAPSPYTGIGFQQMTGVASRVPPAATAFGHRAQQYDCLILSQWDRPADSDDNIAWTRGVFTALSPYLETGVYMNNLGRDEGQDRVRAAFGANYERLAEVKAKYDPTNFFRLNPNIEAARG